mmetsp:Transcript_104605/g.207722  ORF Transcript_104605/g.207722 Transcript_104605/m.207722 type:complete len:235 (+) Transcript_104605:323-1027(+)
MCSDQDSLSSCQLRDDLLFPIRHYTFNRVLEALREGNVSFWQLSILWVPTWMEFAILCNWWWRHVEAASPDLHLLFPVLQSSFLLVQARERSVHTLIQTPAFGDWRVQLVRLLQHNIASLHCTLQHRGVACIEPEPIPPDQLPRLLGFNLAFFGQVYVHPACESVIHVPLRFPMAAKHEHSVVLVFVGAGNGSARARSRVRRVSIPATASFAYATRLTQEILATATTRLALDTC